MMMSIIEKRSGLRRTWSAGDNDRISNRLVYVWELNQTLQTKHAAKHHDQPRVDTSLEIPAVSLIMMM